MPRPSKAAAARAEQADKIADEWFRKINEDDTPTESDVTADLTPTEPDHWTCAAEVADANGSPQVCDRHDKHDPDPKIHGHYWRARYPDAPTEPVVALVRPPSSTGTDRIIAANVVQLAKQAELDHFANAYTYQVRTVTNLTSLLAEATAELAGRELVKPETRAKIRQQIDGWDIQGGIDNAQGGGS